MTGVRSAVTCALTVGAKGGVVSTVNSVAVTSLVTWPARSVTVAVTL